MVKSQNNGIAEGIGNQGQADRPGKASKIGPSTSFELYKEHPIAKVSAAKKGIEKT